MTEVVLMYYEYATGPSKSELYDRLTKVLKLLLFWPSPNDTMSMLVFHCERFCLQSKCILGGCAYKNTASSLAAGAHLISSKVTTSNPCNGLAKGLHGHSSKSIANYEWICSSGGLHNAECPVSAIFSNAMSARTKLEANPHASSKNRDSVATSLFFCSFVWLKWFLSIWNMSS